MSCLRLSGAAKCRVASLAFGNLTCLTMGLGDVGRRENVRFRCPDSKVFHERGMSKRIVVDRMAESAVES
jgi:hypothetical protein